MGPCKRSLSETRQSRTVLPIKGCRLPATLVLTFMLLMPTVLMAQDIDVSDQWRFQVGLYGWLPTLSGSTASGSDIDVDQGELLDTLQMTFQGIVAAEKGKWSFTLDTVYLDVQDDQDGLLNVSSGVVNTHTNVDLQTWIVTPTVGYRFIESEKVKFSIIGGARYLSLDMDVDVDIATSPPRTSHFSDSGGIWDGILGVNSEIALTEQWYLPFYLDIGTGDSDFTWQAALSVGYRFSSFDVQAGYRYLSWDFDDNPALDDLKVNGPYAGFRFRF